MNSAPRMVDSVTTLLVLSAPQKRFIANGRSAEMMSTAVLPTAASLNFLVEIAHTGVSRLGTMLRIFFLPAKSASETSARSLFTSLKSGTVSPTLGKVPATSMGLPAKLLEKEKSKYFWGV